MTIKSEAVHPGEFLISEAPRTRSRDTVTIGKSQTLKAGTVLGQITTGALSAVATAKAGNTGTGTFGSITVAPGTPVGDYNLEIIEPAANAGVFRLEDPNGVEIGHGNVASAFSGGGFGFTVGDATDFIAGDGFKITVSAAAATEQGHYVALNPSATDGSQIAVAVSYGPVVTDSSTVVEALAITRDCEVDGALLDFGGASSPQKTTAKAQLGALGFVIR
jgi:hypothetical protein